MRFETAQHMRMSQQMKLAPRMIQSMEILQMALPQLEERIEQELESNVALELADGGGEGSDPDLEPASGDNWAGGESEQGTDVGVRDRDELDPGGHDSADDFARLGNLEDEYGEAFDNAYESASGNGSVTREQPERQREWEPTGGGVSARLDGERDSKIDAMANTAGRGASLSDELLAQWAFVDVLEELREPGKLIIEHIEEDGYLRTELAKIIDNAGERGRGITLECMERALSAVQLFLEPTGIGARDTRECLLLQIDKLLDEQATDARGRAREIIADHLGDLTQNRIPKIVSATGWSVDEVRDAIDAMKGLKLHPGRELVSEAEPALVPDAVAEWDADANDYRVYLTDARLPALRVNQEYAELSRDRDVPKKDRDFIKTNLSNAQWLIEAVEQRKNTLLRVVKAVVSAQRDVLDQGAAALKPLPMTQVAEQLGIHVATVSRAVAGKHLLTPRGVMPLRMFFTGGTQTAEGEDVSWERIRAAMQEVIDDEDKTKPLSDESISQALKTKGFDIARRTVAKYRDQLDIPAARMRKQYA